MSFYFPTKNQFLIPNDEQSDNSENELYLLDPDMLHDRLPQPFRLINKIVDRIFIESWNKIIDLNANRELAKKKRYKDSVYSIGKLQEASVIQCMCIIEKTQVLIGMKEGLALWNFDEEKQTVLDQWQENEMDVSSIISYKFAENTSLIVVILEDGSARLIAVIHGRMYLIKEFSGFKDDDKPLQVTKMSMDNSCGMISLSFDQAGGDEQWLEVHRINREVWLKEIGVVSKAYLDLLRSQSLGTSDEVVPGDGASNEPSAILDRNSIRVSPTNIIMKMRFPNPAEVLGISNMNQLHKQVDTLGHCIGLGLNHCITKNVIEGRMKGSCVNSKVSSQSSFHILRIANVRYLKRAGSLIQESNMEENADKEYSMIIVWWSESQHLLMYALNKPVPKDLWTKPDGVRSFSCPISACEVSHDTSLIGVGLQNGMFLLIEISSGLTRVMKKISSHPIKIINFLHFKDSEYLQYINVINEKHEMYCAKFNSGVSNDDGEIVQIESDNDADTVVIMEGLNDMALSIYKEGPLIIRDMFTGTAILSIELPTNVTISTSWQPIFAVVGANYLCLQALLKDMLDDTCTSTILLYKLEINQFKYENIVHQKNEEVESKPYINKIADDYLTKRRESHNYRQSRLQEYFVDLHQYLQASVVH